MKFVRIILLLAIPILAWALWRSPGKDMAAAASAGSVSSKTEAGKDELRPDEAKSHGVKGPGGRSAPPVGLGSARTISIPGFFTADAEKIKGFLKSHPDDPQLLSSAALWSDDPEIWSDLRKKAATDPVAAATLSLAAPTAQERLDSALSLSRSDPGNGLSYLAAAAASFHLGDRAAALEFVRQAVEAPHFDLHAAESTRGQQEILRSSSLDEVERGVLLEGDPWQRKAISTLGVLNEISHNAQSPESAADTAGQMLTILDRLQNGIGPAASFGTLQQLSVAEEEILRSLPPDTVTTSDSTARDLARQLGEEQIERGERSGQVRQLLETSSYDIAKEYYRLAASKGEMEASKWLLGH